MNNTQNSPDTAKFLASCSQLGVQCSYSQKLRVMLFRGRSQINRDHIRNFFAEQPELEKALCLLKNVPFFGFDRDDLMLRMTCYSLSRFWETSGSFMQDWELETRAGWEAVMNFLEKKYGPERAGLPAAVRFIFTETVLYPYDFLARNVVELHYNAN